jgi:hypothetical protein
MHVIEYYFKIIWNLIYDISNNGIYDQCIFDSLMFICFYIIKYLFFIKKTTCKFFLNKWMATYVLKV